MTGPLCYDHFETVIGRLWAAVSPAGLCRLAFDQPEDVFLGELRRAYGIEAQHNPEALSAVEGQIREYLAGGRKIFDLSLDLEGQTEFQRDVLLACAGIPYGKTRSYGELARACGRPRGARAVGQVMAGNPIAIVIPCHRVLQGDGKLGGYGGGLTVKRFLLGLEIGQLDYLGLP